MLASRASTESAAIASSGSSQDLLVFFLFYEIAVLPMYLLIGIWGASHAVPAKGPFARAWSAFAVGDRQYAAMKLTLMLLVGSAAILVAIFAMYAAAGSRSFDLADLARARSSMAQRGRSRDLRPHTHLLRHGIAEHILD